MPTNGKPPPGCDEPPTQYKFFTVERLLALRKALLAELLEVP